nr:hypothetical protein [Tanacetum cinerariifolium]
KTKRKATEISQSSGPTTLVADETVHEIRGDRVERVATTTPSLDAEQDNGTINRTQSTAIPNELIPQGTGLECKGCSSFRNSKVKEESQEVRKEEKVKNSTTQEDASKQRRNDQDERISFVQEDAETHGRVIMKEASETASRPIVPPQQQLDPKDKGKGIMQEPEKPVKVKGKDQIALDEEVARRLKAQIQAEFKEERVVEGSKSQAEGSKKRTRKELDEERVKRQKLENDAEKTAKTLFRDNEDKMYYQIIRANRSTKYYKIFSAMLDDFDRQDVLDLYRLIKERFEITSPKDMTDCFGEISSLYLNQVRKMKSGKLNKTTH